MENRWAATQTKTPTAGNDESQHFLGSPGLGGLRRGQATANDSIAKALAWAGESTEVIPTEWWTAKLLLERQIGKKKRRTHSAKPYWTIKIVTADGDVCFGSSDPKIHPIFSDHPKEGRILEGEQH